MLSFYKIKKYTPVMMMTITKNTFSKKKKKSALILVNE